MATEMDAAKEADIIAMHLMQYLTPSKRHAVQLAEPRASMPTPLAVVPPPSNSLSSTARCARGPSNISTSINIRSSLDRQARSLSLSLAGRRPDNALQHCWPQVVSGSRICTPTDFLSATARRGATAHDRSARTDPARAMQRGVHSVVVQRPPQARSILPLAWWPSTSGHVSTQFPPSACLQVPAVSERMRLRELAKSLGISLSISKRTVKRNGDGDVLRESRLPRSRPALCLAAHMRCECATGPLRAVICTTGWHHSAFRLCCCCAPFFRGDPRRTRFVY